MKGLGGIPKRKSVLFRKQRAEGQLQAGWGPGDFGASGWWGLSEWGWQSGFVVTGGT